MNVENARKANRDNSVNPLGFVLVGILLFCNLGVFPFCSLAGESGNEQHKKAGAYYFSDRLAAKMADAAGAGRVDEIEMLIKQGAMVNIKGKDAFTPLLFALVRQNKKGYSTLLKHGADPNIFTTDGTARSVMTEAAGMEDSYWLREALRYGGNPNLKTVGNPFVKGDSPLFYAVLAKRPENVKLLVSAKADLNYKNGKRRFPLLLAAGRQAYDIVFILLEAGADFRQPDHNGDDLIQVVSRRTEGNLPEVQKKWFRMTVVFLEAKGVKVKKSDE